MVFQLLRLSIDISDNEFNSIYPADIELLAQKHWTPVQVAKAASEFLANHPGRRVLDIGSGVGKFCMIGAAHTKGYFTGIEQRQHLVDLSTKLSVRHNLNNVKFIHANITCIDFRDYHSFYFYNSFYENIQPYGRIDDTVKLDIQLYDQYTLYMTEQLHRLPIGARLAGYYASPTIIPQSFQLIDSLHYGRLTFWEKVF
ncbi:MAG TPA: methyltransferase domain-containing protein [Ohtaekwangia sp.]|uniref:class I SAM-dependent methyltransferase n=1 Tax=Ohtaekwangia sp. TaxID=2066019 RepID=UPI002F94B6CE